MHILVLGERDVAIPLMGSKQSKGRGVTCDTPSHANNKMAGTKETGRIKDTPAEQRDTKNTLAK